MSLADKPIHHIYETYHNVVAECENATGLLCSFPLVQTYVVPSLAATIAQTHM